MAYKSLCLMRKRKIIRIHKQEICFSLSNPLLKHLTQSSTTKDKWSLDCSPWILITRTFFSHNRSELFSEQNTNHMPDFSNISTYKFLSCFTFFNTTDHEFFFAGFMNFVSEVGASLERNKLVPFYSIKPKYDN